MDFKRDEIVHFKATGREGVVLRVHPSGVQVAWLDDPNGRRPWYGRSQLEHASECQHVHAPEN